MKNSDQGNTTVCTRASIIMANNCWGKSGKISDSITFKDRSLYYIIKVPLTNTDYFFKNHKVKTQTIHGLIALYLPLSSLLMFVVSVSTVWSFLCKID